VIRIYPESVTVKREIAMRANATIIIGIKNNQIFECLGFHFDVQKMEKVLLKREVIRVYPESITIKREIAMRANATTQTGKH
jgi:hypothetical protein